MIEQNHLLYALSVLEGSLSGIDNKKISNDVLTSKNKLRSTIPTDSSYEDNNIPLTAELKTIMDTMSNDFEKFTGTHTLASAEYWGHIQENKMSTNYHNHGSVGVSGVYYCQIPENSAKIVFWWKENPNTPPRRNKITPQEGRYFLFPSYLYHSVPIHESETPRISLSFNFNVREINKFKIPKQSDMLKLQDDE